MRKVIPTVFARNKKEFNERLKRLSNISKDIQVDFMDGKFVSEKSIKFSLVPNLKKFNKNFEAHLMTFWPEKKIGNLKRKGFSKIIFHYESTKNFEEVSKKIKDAGMKSFVAVNPKTSLRKIFPILPYVDGVLLMGVRPGREHQKFINSVYQKIGELKKSFPKIIIQIDGGVNLLTAKQLKKAGADVLNTGSFVADAKNPRLALEELKRVFI